MPSRKPSVIRSELARLRNHPQFNLPEHVKIGLPDTILLDIRQRQAEIIPLQAERAVIITRVGEMIRDVRERGVMLNHHGQPIKRGDDGFAESFVDWRNRLYSIDVDDREPAIDRGTALAVASKMYVIQETELVFGGEAGDDVAGSYENIGTAAGRQSAHHDLGARTTASAGDWRFRVFNQAQATPTLNNVCSWYLKTSDASGAHADNDDGTTDLAVSATDKTGNLRHFASVLCDQAAANIEYVKSGEILGVVQREISVVMWNAFGSSTTNDDTENKCFLAPMPPEQQ